MAVTPTADADARLDEAVARLLLAEERGEPLASDEWLADQPAELRPRLERFLADRAATRTAFAVATADPAADDGFEPGAEFDGLRIVRLRRAGGMARVYEGEQTGLGVRRAVAVKALPPAGDEQRRELFRAEVRAVALLSHPHVVPVLKWGERLGRPYLVMPLYPGSLKDRLAAGPLPPRESATVVRAVAQAVAFAHTRGFLHRDLKPSNVLLDERGTPLLADFGLAAAGGRSGTAGYMAPCQHDPADGQVDERTDVYGLGAVLYECLTGRPPNDPAADGWRPPPSPSAVRAGVDPRLEAICRRCLQPRQADRPATAAAVANELDVYLRPPGRRRAVMVAAVVVMALAVGLLLGRWPWSADPNDPAQDSEYARLTAGVRDRVITRPMGWTWANREEVKRAAALRTPLRSPVVLRTELARTYAHPDLREVGTAAAGARYEAVAFRPGTGGNQLAVAPLWRNKDADPPDHPRVDLFDRTAGRVVRSWRLPFSSLWEGRREKKDGMSAATFTPDGRWLVVATRSGGIHVIDPDADADPRRLVQERETVKHLLPTADGSAVLTVCLDGNVRRWRVSDWKQEEGIQLPTNFPAGWAITAGVCPRTGDLIVSTPQRPQNDNDPTVIARFTPHLVKLDEVRYGGLLRLPSPHPFAPVVMASAWGEQPHTIEQLVTGWQPPKGFDAGLDKYTERTGFTPDGRVYFTGADSPMVKFWDPAAFTPVGQVKYVGGNGCVAMAPDSLLIGVSDGECVHLFERSAGGPERRVGFHGEPPDAIGLSADGRELVTAKPETYIQFWDVATGRWVGTRTDLRYDHSHGDTRVLPAVASGGFGVPVLDGLRVLYRDRPPRTVYDRGGDDHHHIDPRERAWVWKTGQLTVGQGGWRPRPSGPEVQPVTAAAVDGDRAVLPLTDGRAVLFDLRAGLRAEREWRWEGPKWTATALMPEGGRLIAGDAAGRVRLIDPTDGREVASAAVHSRAVTAVVPLADGWVLTGGQDGLFALGRVAGDALTVEATVPLDRPVRAVTAAADRVTVGVLCEGERQVRVWRLDELNAAWADAGVGLDLPAAVAVPLPPPRKPVPADATGPGLWWQVYKTKDWSGQPVREDMGQPDLCANWSNNSSPSKAIRDEFSVEWRGYLTPPSAGQYRFRVRADDHVALHLGGRPVCTFRARFDSFESEGNVGEAELASGATPVRVEYAEFGGHAWLTVEWSKPGRNGFDWRPIDPEHLSPHRRE